MNAPFEKIEKDNDELLMLLGECNYIVREFHNYQKKIKQPKNLDYPNLVCLNHLSQGINMSKFNKVGYKYKDFIVTKYLPINEIKVNLIELKHEKSGAHILKSSLMMKRISFVSHLRPCQTVLMALLISQSIPLFVVLKNFR